jgi:hypothetical protein
MMKRAVFAELATLQAYGCEHLSTADSPEDVLIYSGWRFRTRHCKILDSSELNDAAKQIAHTIAEETPSDDHIRVAGHDLHVPAMIFGKDLFNIETNEDSKQVIGIDFNASDALSCWADQHSPDATIRHPVKIVQVPYAKSWSERLERHQTG